MAHIRIDRSNVATHLFQKVYHLLAHLFPGPLAARKSSAVRLTDRQATEAFSGLSEEQLRDIGVYRKLRRRKWDLFDRNLSPECEPVFDYFRLDR